MIQIIKQKFKTIFWALLLALFLPVHLIAQDDLEEHILELAADSLLNGFSLDELTKFREFYQGEIQNVIQESNLLQEKILQDGEKLFSINPDHDFMDRILYRMGDFYFRKTKDEFFKEMEKYEEAFTQFEEGKTTELPEEPKPDYSASLKMYKIILEKSPDSKLTDGTLYHYAFALEKSYRSEEAVPYYMQLTNQYSSSRYAPEALIRLGEFHFSPIHRDLDKAIEYYTKALDYRDTHRYNEALYKLGWSYYLIERYSDAVYSFTVLVQDIEEYEHEPGSKKFVNPTLKNEALEYIGVCFRYFGGLDKVLTYVDSLGRPGYGAEVLKKLGDIYRENEEKYIQAKFVYMALLERYPYYLESPKIQEKIVLCAKGIEDDDEVFLAQQRLFDVYRPESEWQIQVQQLDIDPYQKLKVLQNASQKAELAQRANINLLISLGEKKKDAGYYQLVVEEAKKYLTTFQFDTSAYIIHWNMALILDTKLNQKEEAYQEYLRICNDYLSDEYKRNAAENAIVLAREFSEQDKVQDELETLQIAAQVDSSEQVVSQASTQIASTEKLIEAYNNFIMHYPEDEITAEVLRNVGTMYYNNDDFDLSLRYFSTLAQNFPASPFASQAQFSILESYFGMKDFNNAEIIAKKIQNDERLSPELRDKIKTRLAESIYLDAEALVGENKHLEAAQRFRELYVEVPDAEFADKSIFQAGVQFDLAKAFPEAIEAYKELIDNFESSDHYLDAVNNLAIDYGEIEDFTLAASTYEKLSSSQPDLEKAKDALYNSSYFYTKQTAWSDAIRVNRAYVDRFPDAEDTEDIFYDLAELYLKFDDFENANSVYGEFASRFPDSPRGVETHFKRGAYYLNRNQVDSALQEFDLAVKRNDELKSKSLETNDFYAAEALFLKTEEQYKYYDGIQFNLAHLESAQKEKRDLLKKLVNQYTRVAAYGTNRLYEATFNVGKAYEDFAVTWSEKELPDMNEMEKVVYLKKQNKTSVQLYEKAFESYKTSFLALQKLVDNYSSNQPQEEKQNTGRAVEEDSTLQVAGRWIKVSGEKVSHMLFNMAELNVGSIDPLLNAPIPTGLDEVTSLEYRNQVLAKAVYPVVEEVTKAYIRGLEEAGQHGLENNWVAKSRTGLFNVMTVLTNQYKKLFLDAFATYEEKYDRYVNLMNNGTEEEQENTLDLAGSLVNLIELGNNYAGTMNTSYKLSIDNVIQQPFGNTIANSIFSDLIQTTVQLSAKLEESSKHAAAMKDKFTVQNQQTPKMAYEDAIFTFSDLESYLHDNALELGENTYALSKEYGFNSPNLNKLTVLLVNLNPQTYAAEFEVPTDGIVISPDESWVYTTEIQDSTWMMPEFSDETWQPADVLEDFSNGGEPILLSRLPEPVELDSSATNSTQDTQIVLAPQSYYLRKAFKLDNKPLSAKLKLNADDNVKVYVNGISVFEEQDESLGWGNVFETDLSPFLKVGKNLIAIKLDDTDGSGHGVQPIIELQTLNLAAFEEQQKSNTQLDSGKITTMDEQIYIRNFVPEK